MTVDVSGWIKAFDGMDDKKESLARRMGVSGGKVIEDAARANVPEGDRGEAYRADWKTGSSESQQYTLRDAIYLAFRDNESGPTQVVYAVSWNSAKAFWGVFVEFGFQMTHQVIQNEDGTYFTLKGIPRKGGTLQVESRPFLGQAFDANSGKAIAAMLARGKEEFPKLLAEIR